MKITRAVGSAGAMTEDEVNRFLESKLNLQLATIDDMDDPNIDPVWFGYDKDKNKLFVMTLKGAKKVQNIRRKSKIFFSIDDENFPYKGVKGKGEVTILEDAGKRMSIVEKITLKYLGTLDHPLARVLIENTKNGTETVLEIIPKYYSTWDMGKT